MSKHPVDAALSALAAHLGTALPGLTVSEGWPENDEEAALPELTIVRASTPAYELIAPSLLCFEDGVATYRYGYLSFTVQLDLWARYKATRAQLAHAVEAALAGDDLPHHTGLWLTATDYHGRPLTLSLTESEPMDDADSAPGGIWRHRWAVECRTDLVLTKAVPSISQVDIRLITEEAGQLITELQTVFTA